MFGVGISAVVLPFPGMGSLGLNPGELECTQCLQQEARD